jgi:hypothetical protein
VRFPIKKIFNLKEEYIRRFSVGMLKQRVVLKGPQPLAMNRLVEDVTSP